MENLLQLIKNNDGKEAVSARNLYTYLGYDSGQWKRWYTKNILNNQFAFENEDYQVFDSQSKSDKGGRPTKNFALSIDFAKKICMMSKTKKGEEARDYYLKCEEVVQTIVSEPKTEIPQTFAEALRLAADTLEKNEKLQIENTRLHERTDFIDIVFTANDLLSCSEVCNILNLSYGNKTLFKKLRESGIFFKNRNEPKQIFVDKGYFRMKENLYKDKVTIQTFFTQKGLGYVAKFLGVIIPQINRVKFID